MPAPTHGRQTQCSKLKRKMTGYKEHETLTKAIHNKGFSVYSSILTRSNFCVGGQEISPLSHTAYSLDR